MSTFGGRDRARTVLVLGGVLALSGADTGTVSAMALPLKNDFGISNTQIGLLISVVTLAGALWTVPVGLLTDRARRTRLLTWSTALWGTVTFLSGFAPSYGWLLVSRAALGAASATAGPTVASLIGDFVPVRERARTYGFILGGELAGTGLGLAVSGAVGSAFGWRFAFWWLAGPTALLVWALGRLPEPERGGQVRSQPTGQTSAADSRHHTSPSEPAPGLAEQAAERAGVRPAERRVLRTDPRLSPPWQRIRYVLRVPTNVVLILASGLGYCFFTGMRAFAPLFATDRYGVSPLIAAQLVLVVGLGALVVRLTWQRLTHLPKRYDDPGRPDRRLPARRGRTARRLLQTTPHDGPSVLSAHKASDRVPSDHGHCEGRSRAAQRALAWTVSANGASRHRRRPPQGPARSDADNLSPPCACTPAMGRHCAAC